jgi:hypothetical protein
LDQTRNEIALYLQKAKEEIMQVVAAHNRTRY